MNRGEIMKKSMLLLFLVSIVFVVGCSEAGVLFSPEKSSNFVPYKFYEFNINWQGAKDYCDSLGEGWHLATINNAEEQEYIYGTIIGYPSNRNKPTWIGLRDINNDTLYEDYEWDYGNSSYRQWHQGYGIPYNNPGWCGWIDNGLAEQGNWHDSPCDYTIASAVCEFNGCTDGTNLNQCSISAPYFCDGAGTLTQDCSTCGCPSGARCIASTGRCSFKTLHRPKMV
jgi:hypothetical protein